MKGLKPTINTAALFGLLIVSLPSLLHSQKPGAFYFGDSDNGLVDGPDLTSMELGLAALDPGYWLIPPSDRARTALWQDLDGNGILDGPDYGIIQGWLGGDFSDCSGNPSEIAIEDPAPGVEAGNSVVVRAYARSGYGALRPGWGMVFEITGGSCDGALVYGRDPNDGGSYGYFGDRAYEYTAEPFDGGWANVRVVSPGTCGNGQTIELEVYFPADSEYGIPNSRMPERLTAWNYSPSRGGTIERIVITVSGTGLPYVTGIELRPNPATVDEGSTISFRALCALSDASTVDCTSSYQGGNTQWTSVGDLTQLNPANLFQGNLYGGNGAVTVIYDDGANPPVSDAVLVTVLDVTPPDTFINSHPPDPSNSSDAAFSFNCNEPSCGFECKLDSMSFSPCSSPKNYSGLSDGIHLFQVRAVDGGGNSDPNPAGYSWRVEAGPPDTLIVSSPAAYSIQSVALFEFACTDPECSYQCRIDSSAWSSCVSPLIYNLFWGALSDGGAPPARYRHSAVWTGSEMIVWGGSPPTNTGGRYNPVTDSWLATSTINAPLARYGQTAVWTDYLMIVWGGRDAPLYNTGGKYNPATDAWTATSTTAAPAGRAFHSAVWTGTEMIVWGGIPNVNTGGRYNPAADSWAATSTANAPSARSFQSAAWSGNEMMIWGGHNGAAYLNTGARYYPSSNSWASISSANAPGARRYHTALWTGTRMLIWGGDGGSALFDTGGRYNPAADSWSATSTTNAPQRRYYHSAVWTGTEMVVWGGFYTDGTWKYWLNTGGKYNPASNSWAATEIQDAPSGRERHSALWTGSVMIAWGGTSSLATNTGSKYYANAPKFNPTEASHLFEVKATDLSGNTDPSPALYNWTIDRTAPNTSISSSPHNPSGQGFATFNFSANETGCAFECKLDAGLWETCVSPKIYAGIPDGYHSFSSRAIDRAGNVDSTPAAYSWQIDTVAPETTLNSQPADPSNSQNASFAFSCNEGSCSFECKLDGRDWTACAGAAQYYSLAEGIHSFQVRAKDPANNLDPTPASYSFRVDTIDPDTFIALNPPNPSPTRSAGFGFNGNEENCSFECRMDLGQWSDCSSPINYSGLNPGAHSFEARAMDSAGNLDPSPAVFNWTINLITPYSFIIAHPDNPTGERDALFEFNCAGGPCSYQCQLDSGSWNSCVSPGSYRNLGLGIHNFQVRATDGFGQLESEPSQYQWEIIDLDPDIPDTFINSGPADPSSIRSADFEFSCDEAGCSFECKMDSAPWTNCSSPKNYSGIDPGVHTFQARATDTGGNRDPSPAGYSWSVNISAPYSMITAHPGNFTTEREAAFAFDCAGGPCSFECQLDSGGWSGCASPVSFSALGLGPHSFQVRATDGSGQTEPEPSQYQWQIIVYLQVASGYAHTCAIANNGMLWCWGDNSAEEIGPDYPGIVDAPVPASADTDWALVSAGGSHTCAIKSNGKLFCWGGNGSGQLGNGFFGSSDSSPQVGSENNWQKISAGADQSCALKSNGTLWCWGGNSLGQLGDGTSVDKKLPVQIGTATDWREISAGKYHSCSVKNNGSLYCFGYNYFGQLGDGTQTDRLSPTRVGAALDWRGISAGYQYSCATKTGGSLWCWGLNQDGKAGLGAVTQVLVPTRVGADSDWSGIKSFWNHSCGIRNSQQLWCFGANDDGQLGDGARADQRTPIRIGADADWLQVAGGGVHSCAAKVNGEVYCWGDNWYSQLGLGFSGGNKNSPVQEAASGENWEKVEGGAGRLQSNYGHNCGIKSDGSLSCFGDNSFGELGLGDTLKQQIPLQVGADLNWIDLVGGGGHFCALKNNDSLWCWGDNGSGQLGDGTWIGKWSPVQIGSGISWKQIAGGYAHTCGIKSNDTLWCWGYNGVGQLGDGTTVWDRNTPAQVGAGNNWSQVSAGAYHSCGLKNDGSAWCWGEGWDGELGNGTTADKNVPTRVGTESNWLQIAGGDSHTCALKTNGTLWCWGYNYYGQLGIGNSGSGSDKKIPTQAGTDADWAQLSAGGNHSCALKSDHSLWCCGYGGQGQLGTGTFSSRSALTRVGTGGNWEQVSADGDHTCAVRTDHTLFCFGNNQSGQLGDGTAWRDTPQRVKVR